MGILRWVSDNWFNLANLIVGSGLWFTGISLHLETKTQRVANLFAAIQNHRELWTDFYRRPELARILDPRADTVTQPPTLQEEGFVKLVIQHATGVFKALENGLLLQPDGLRLDIGSFFSLPVPSVVWQKVKRLQDKEFVAFVDSCCCPGEKQRAVEV